MRPTLRTVRLLAAGIPVALVPALAGAWLWPLWLLFAGGALAAWAIDAVLALPARRLELAVTLPPVVHIGEPEPMVVALTAAGWRRRLAVEVTTDLDEDLEPQPITAVTLAPAGDGAAARLDVALAPRRRGELAVRAVWLRWTGPLGLAARQRRHPVDRAVAVIPNVRAVRRAALSFWARDALHGLKVERFIGGGSEFDALREHVAGHDHRAIDWKHSARHRRLVSKEHRAERNHQIVIAVDAGALMREPIDGVPKLDHALNAGLLLGWFSLRGGDRVGLYGFDAKPRLWAEPISGAGGFPRLSKLAAGLDYAPVETNFTLGLADLARRLTRRTLVVLLTDFVDTVTAELMLENVSHLARRHLVVFVTLRDPGLGALVAAPPHGLPDMYRAVVAGDQLRERDVVLQRLRRRGVRCIDAAPAEIGVDLVNRYLDIKRRELV
jgi:uncharacterized protein (DUF58 family)